MGRTSWPRAVGKEKPEKESPGILNQQETGRPRAHSPVLAAWTAVSLTLHLHLRGGAELWAPQRKLAKKNQVTWQMSVLPTHPCLFPWTYPGEGSWEILEKGNSCALKTTGQFETNWQEDLNEWAVSAPPHSVSAGSFSEGC